MRVMTSGLFYARCALFNVAKAYASDPTAVDHLGLGLHVTNRLSPYLGRQRLLKISFDVVDMFQTDRHAHHGGSHTS